MKNILQTQGLTIINTIKRFFMTLMQIPSFFSTLIQREKKISGDATHLRLLIMNSKNQNIGAEW
ncbi:hypothetical protein ACJRPK_11855 [Aquimarina sp. 2-A2]|uniref:hypothetical protein n=1 Tax=Aquimarina sp. 2-A2 TaxID=3382644 RepID=UPI00387F0ECA